MNSVCAAFLLLLAAWGTFTSHRLFSAKRPWSRLKWLSFCCIVLLVGGSLSSGAGLLTGHFAPWMLIPIGISYITMLPLPCYFPWVTATNRRRALRNATFIVFATLLLGFGFGIIPLSDAGL